MECSGHFSTGSGTIINFGGAGSMLIASRVTIDNGTYDEEEGASIIITGSSAGDDQRFRDSTFVGDATTNILINNGTTSCDWDESEYYRGNLIVASPVESINADRNQCGNLTIPTGGTLDGNDDTITVAGDFTTSGGLIGKSALDFDGTNDYVDLSNDSDWQFGTSNFTLEAWFRSDGGSGNRTIIANGDASNNGFLLYMQSSNNIKFFVNAIAVCNAADVSYEDSKWHHVAAVRDGNDYLLYIDGKLKDKSTQSSQNLTHSGKASIGARDISATPDAYWKGQIAMVRAFNDARTQAELRADMFNAHASMANTGNLVAMYQFDEGTGSTVDNIETDDDLDGTISGASWVGAGTFTHGTSTLVFAKSGTQTFTYNTGGEDVNNLTVNDGSTTNLKCLQDTGGVLDVFGNLVVNEKLGVTVNEQIKIKTGDKTITIGSDVKTSAVADLFSIQLDHTSGNINIPELTTKRITCRASSATTTATGDLTLTSELEVNSGATFNANTNTINVKNTDVNGGTLDLRNSTLNFYTGASDTWTMSSSSTLTTGNTTVTGDSTKTPTNIPESAGGGFEIVGDVSNLDVTGDLTVIGSVTNCIGNIRQFFHTLDTQQLLDADEAGDDDLRLEKPNLDNSHELQTG